MIEQPSDPARPNVVVIGGGFGGLSFVKSLKRTQAEVFVIDRQNHHLFQPLLYQVAMAGLAATEVAAPIRSVLSRRRDVTVMMKEVTRIDPQRQRIVMGDAEELHYDYLVLAAGGTTTYFGNEHWEEHAPGLKTLNDAVRIRREVLAAFEAAETSLDTDEQERLMTVLVVGGGPTGVELAGAVAELIKRVFKRDFRRIDLRNTRVILIESGDRLLKAYPESLSASALRQLKSLGVEVILNTRVAEVDERGATLTSGQRIDAGNVLWGAGVKASRLTSCFEAQTDRAGRLLVEPDLSVPGHPNVFAIGDLVRVTDVDGQDVPGVAPAAMQMGKHAARLIHDEITQGPQPPDQRKGFDYWDKGSMATIGRKRAVAWMGPLKFGGLLAWLAWLTVHLLFLVSFRNKVSVLIEWIYSYITYQRGARIIVPKECPSAEPEAEPPEHEVLHAADDASQ